MTSRSEQGHASPPKTSINVFSAQCIDQEHWVIENLMNHRPFVAPSRKSCVFLPAFTGVYMSNLTVVILVSHVGRHQWLAFRPLMCFFPPSSKEETTNKYTVNECEIEFRGLSLNWRVSGWTIFCETLRKNTPIHWPSFGNEPCKGPTTLGASKMHRTGYLRGMFRVMPKNRDRGSVQLPQSTSEDFPWYMMYHQFFLHGQSWRAQIDTTSGRSWPNYSQINCMLQLEERSWWPPADWWPWRSSLLGWISIVGVPGSTAQNDVAGFTWLVNESRL